MSTTVPKPDMAQQLEQFQTHLENLAELMATYYKSLIAKGVPEQTARDLVVEFQKNILTLRA